ncbi:MAG: T9SS type A sorting domain-containing protein [Bacteroidetes bacterium]|nr:T9SS type A sorting domain-containing protein [Bacteroidota bacterium]
MKKLLLIFFLFVIASEAKQSLAQGTWTQKANFGGTARWYAVGFSIGTKGYIGTGDDGSVPFKKDFWEWDQSTDVWTQKANFGGTARRKAVGFSIGTKGYIGTGDANTGGYQQDFWEWDQSTNVWTQKTNFGGAAREFAVGFSIGTKGYIGTGYDNFFGPHYKDFWEWDQSTDVWTQKADFGGTARYVAVGFSIGTKGYIGTGDTSIYGGGFKKDFWEWDQSTNVWTQKANFAGKVGNNAVAFSIGTKGYIGTGRDTAGIDTQDFWEWDQSANVWTQKTNFGSTAREFAVGFSIGTKGYIGTGGDGNYKNDFWEYNSSCGTTLPSICLITVDSLSQNNIIVWEKQPNQFIDSFIIYREILTNNYQPVGAVAYDSLSMFVDTVRTLYFPNTGDPNAGTYRYKITVKDTCGNYSNMSSYHNTIYMTNNSGTFFWNFYTIEGNPNPVNSYVLMRDDFNTGNWQPVNSVSGTQNTVTDPAYAAWAATANWRIQTIWNISCTPSIKNPVINVTNLNTSRSNNYKTNNNSVNETSLNDLINISPNPTSGKINVQMSRLENPPAAWAGVQMNIYNIYGECIYQHICTSAHQQIDLSEANSGIYFLQVKTSEGIANKKIVISR